MKRSKDALGITLVIAFLLPTTWSFGQVGYSDPFSQNAGQAGQSTLSLDTPAVQNFGSPTMPGGPAPVQLPPNAPAPQQSPGLPPVPNTVTPSTALTGPQTASGQFTPQPPPPGQRSAGPAAANVPPTFAQTPPKGAPPKSRQEMAQQKREPRLVQSIASPGHPLVGYLDVPKDPQSLITGKPMPLAELLDGVRSVPARRQLLQGYWNLVGSLAEYNCRAQAEQQAAGAARDAQSNQTINLLRMQRRATEIEFTKKQWHLAGLIKRHKGTAPDEIGLPIPVEYPLVKKYDTHAEKIARSERSQYVARMIPIQEQLVKARHIACSETFEMYKSIPQSSQQLLLMLNQRTAAFLEMTEAIVDYNNLIADYATETISGNVGGHQLIGALVELPRQDSTTPGPRQEQQMATPDPRKLTGTPDDFRPSDFRSMPGGPESSYAAQAALVAENRQQSAEAGTGRPARAFERRPGEFAEGEPPMRRRGHPDVTQAAFESVMASEQPGTGAIAQASHLEPQPLPKPELEPESAGPPPPPTGPPRPKTLPEPTE